jgi:tetratricopeptide (TPR) repeat protein
VEEGVQQQVLAIAAVLTAVRGRLDELAGRLPEEEAPSEGEETKPGLKSILSCVLRDAVDPAIRDLLLAAEQEAAPATEGGAGGADYRAIQDLLRVAEEESPPPLAGPGELEGAAMSLPTSRFGRKLQRRLAEHERAAREAEELYRELQAVGASRRPGILEDSRFHRLALVEKLLEEAQSALPDDPTTAEELAHLAATAAGYLANVEEVAQARARAACRIANARRLAGDHAAAEQALAHATALSGDAGAQAELCRALALVRWEQGRTEEAAALLERAAALWAEEEVTYEESSCRVLRALLLVEEGAAKDAVAPLRDNLPLLADLELTLYGGLALALGLAERGLLEKAVARRAESVALVHRMPPAAYLYALRLQGEIATSLGELAPSRDELKAAETHFDELRFEALAAGFLPEAAVGTLALAHLDALRGCERERGRERVSALAATFGEAEGLAGVLDALHGYPDQRPAGESLRDFTAALLANLPRLLRLHGARSAPLPFA